MKTASRLNGYVSTAVKFFRQERLMTQKECSAFLGVSQSQYNRLENGRNPWNVDGICKVAAALGLTELAIFERAVEMRSKCSDLNNGISGE